MGLYVFSEMEKRARRKARESAKSREKYAALTGQRTCKSVLAPFLEILRRCTDDHMYIMNNLTFYRRREGSSSGERSGLSEQ